MHSSLGWRKLSHICQRWHYLIYEFTFHLDIHILCTNGTPLVDELDHLPPLPLVVQYVKGYRGAVSLTEQDRLGLYNALCVHNRVRGIEHYLPPSVLHEVLLLMDKHFPILESLHLSLMAESTTIQLLTLPKAFQAPNLRYFTLLSISPPIGFRFLTSTVSLVGLELRNIHASNPF